MVRQATAEDYEAVTRIKTVLTLDVTRIQDKAYRVKVQKEGFLLKTPTTKSAFARDLQKLFLVSEQEKEVGGYIRIDEVPEIKKETKVYWFRPEVKELYLSFSHACIGGIGVHPYLQFHGIGKELLSEAEGQLKERGIKHLFSFIVLSPVTNTASLLFHESNGFERAGTPLPRPLFDMEGYQSILYHKEL